MGKIKVLPDVVASQVAAGEVVERPASVAKELVENSLDAGAGQIEVRADRGGVALIRVADDGCGMSRDDALLCLERHATSKLRTIGGLAEIRTLGFRGEAVPSIASVSKFTLQTREAQALAGTEVVVEGGRLQDVRDWGGAPGTVVEVRQLFLNVPARRKFLRSEATEASHVEQTLRVQALAHPAVGFTLLRDGRVVFQLPPGSSLRERIEGLTGAEVAGGLVECPPREAGGLRVSGWVAAPDRTRSDRALTLFFVNGRPIESPVFHFALRAAYGEALARGKHPPCFLFIEMDPGAVDINVHPAKREARFRNGLAVQEALSRVLQEVLTRAAARSVAPWGGAARGGSQGRASSADEDQPAATAVPPGGLDQPEPAGADGENSSSGGSPEEARRGAPAEPAARAGGEFPVIEREAPPVLRPLVLPSWPGGRQEKLPLENAPERAKPAGPAFRLLGLLAGTYAVLEGEEGLVLMEMRAAHERVLYETLRRELSGGSVAMQPLLVPMILPLPPRDFALARENLEGLRRLGFAAEEFGAHTLKVDALPALLSHRDPATFFTSLLHDLAQSGEGNARLRLEMDALTAAVCARAAPRETERTGQEAEALLQQLLSCEMPYCDPAGRPTLIQFSHQELARKFQRR